MRVRNYQFVEDEALVRDARTGNRKAFDALVRRFRGAVTLVACDILGSRALAEDVTQDVFVVAFYSLPRLREPAKFAGWLFAIARYRARRVSQQERRFIPTEPSQLQHLSESTSASQNAGIPLERQPEWQETIEAMKPEYRTVILLRYAEQWPIARIAAFLLLPATTVHWRLHQARKQLRQALAPIKETEDERIEPEPSPGRPD